MRRFFMLAVLLAGVGLFFGRTAQAQQSSQSEPPGLRVLSHYVLPQSALPVGFVQTHAREQPNEIVAALAEDPAQVQKIVLRGRIEGAEQELQASSGQSATIDIELQLFRDAAGAQADLNDPVGLRLNALTPASTPSLGDASAAYTAASRAGPAAILSFTIGRLEVSLIETGAAPSVGDLQTLATRLAGQAQDVPPPPPDAAELALLQTETTPESILRDAYDFLLALYLKQLPPADVLGAAYAGASKALTDAGATNLPPAPVITASDPDEAFAQFLPAYQQLEALAVSLSPRDLAYAAAKQMYASLNNCHNHFYPPSFYDRLIAELNGAPFAGIGINRTPHLPVVVLRVFPDSPAADAGIRAGDQILAADHITPQQVGEAAFTLLLSGEAGTSVTLTIQRPGVADPFDITLTRRFIKPIIEQHSILPGGIGYIDFENFTQDSQAIDRLRTALNDFQADGSVRAWILDLRYNGGGSVGTLQQVAGLFVPNGSLLATAVAQDGTSRTVRSMGSPTVDQKPLVILTGEDTASAAEILSQSMHDLGRATLIGSQTSGCVNGGPVLGLLDRSGVFVSASQYLAGPNQTPLEGIGISPDQRVDRSLDDLINGRDPQLDAAIAYLSSQ